MDQTSAPVTAKNVVLIKRGRILFQTNLVSGNKPVEHESQAAKDKYATARISLNIICAFMNRGRIDDTTSNETVSATHRISRAEVIPGKSTGVRRHAAELRGRNEPTEVRRSLLLRISLPNMLSFVGGLCSPAKRI